MIPSNPSLLLDPPVFLTIRPHGFLCQGREYPSFSASILATSTVRKRFLNGNLVCSSPDAINAKDGSPCHSCPHRPDCLPRIRLRLRPLSEDLPRTVFLELSFSSAKNFLDYFTNLLSQNLDPLQLNVRLSVLNRGRWGEVLFSLHPNPSLIYPENPCPNSSPPP
jgi:hypothetical protein